MVQKLSWDQVAVLFFDQRFKAQLPAISGGDIAGRLSDYGVEPSIH